MDGIIMAAGKGRRMRPLTLNTPKPLLSLQGRPILAWSLMSLHGIVDRLLVAVSYLKAQIEAFMARQTLFAAYTLVEQLPQPLGTGHALQCCRDHLQSDDFLVVNGDDLYSHAALRQLSQQKLGILSMLKDSYGSYGVIRRSEQGHFIGIDEKPPQDRFRPPAACNTGAYKLTAAVFDYTLEKSPRGEYEISDYVSQAAQHQAVAVIDSPFWLPIGNPAALHEAQSVDIRRWIPEREP